MMLLLSVEWMRFRRRTANLVLVLATLLLLCACAWFAGTGAADYRAQQQARQAGWQDHLAAAQSGAAGAADGESAGAARAAYEFGRGKAPPALRPALDGLVLAVQQFRRQPFDVQVSLDSRHLDPRRSAPLDNPLLDSFGVPDFAVAAAMLLPLAVIALTYGLAHEPREQGISRLIGAQAATHRRLLWAGLAIRWAAVTTVAALASLLAFLLDPGSGGSAYAVWISCTALYTALWILFAGLFNATRLSSAATALGMLGLSLLLNVAAPALLQHHASQRAALPARERAVVEIRAIQQHADDDMARLLAAWYAHHPDHQPKRFGEHTWPVSYIPKTLWQDARIEAIMASFDGARSAQAELLQPWQWVTPGLALVRAGDRLAGADPVQFERYMRMVAQLEQRWRQAISPAVMNYRGVTRQTLTALPVFDPALPQPGMGGVLSALLASVAGAAAALAFRVRKLRI